jgi:methyl-accepting chemotaxis protein
MSHDITIASLQDVALSIQVLGDQGYGFLIDENSGVIAHPHFQDVDANKGTQDDTLLLETGTPDYQQLIANMVAGQSGLGYYAEEGSENLLVYAPIPATGWSLGIAVPREVVIAPALEMRNRALTVTGVLVVTAVIMAILLTHFIHRPLVKLLQGVHQVSENGRADVINVDSFTEFEELAAAFNDMAAKVWEREEKLKKKVASMSIEIDTQRTHKQLDAIVETDFFKRLEVNAQRLREDIKGLSLTKEA